MRVFNLAFTSDLVQGERYLYGKRRPSTIIFTYFAVIYLFKKLKSQSILYNWRRYEKNDIMNARVRLVKYFDIINNSVSLINFALFMKYGRYPTVLLRLAHLELGRMPITTTKPMLVSKDVSKSATSATSVMSKSSSDLTDSQLSYVSKIIMFNILMAS